MPWSQHCGASTCQENEEQRTQECLSHWDTGYGGQREGISIPPTRVSSGISLPPTLLASPSPWMWPHMQIKVNHQPRCTASLGAPWEMRGYLILDPYYNLPAQKGLTFSGD